MRANHSDLEQQSNFWIATSGPSRTNSKQQQAELEMYHNEAGTLAKLRDYGGWRTAQQSAVAKVEQACEFRLRF